MYANNLQIYVHVHRMRCLRDTNEVIEILNENLTSVFKWAKKFGLKLNPEKS
mgnify:CR=1 FL=1